MKLTCPICKLDLQFDESVSSECTCRRCKTRLRVELNQISLHIPSATSESEIKSTSSESICTQELQDALRKFEIANLQLQQANKHKTRFLSSVSHELRTPLTAILGGADLLAAGACGPLSNKQLEYVQMIASGGSHLLSLINNLLQMAKIDAGAMELQLGEFSPVDLMNTLRSLLGMQFQHKNLDVTFTIDPTIVAIRGDVQKCRQILLNLLSNALKYTPANGRISVRVKCPQPNVIRFEVADTGVGIAADRINRIFDEYYQVDQQRDHELGGTGIGLALTRRLVELHGGNIGVFSKLGEGSTFWFTLPQSKPAVEPLVAATPPREFYT